MLVICGPSCIGKDTFIKFLKEFGWIKITSMTTRPKREGEVDRRDYEFVDEKYFNYLSNEDKLFEETEYIQENGDIWRYGTHKECWDGDTSKKCVILNPKGIYDLDSMGYKYDLLYFKKGNPDMNDVLRERYIERGGDDSKWLTRLTQDIEDFVKFDDYIANEKLSCENLVTINLYPHNNDIGDLKVIAGIIDEIGMPLFSAIQKFNLYSRKRCTIDITYDDPEIEHV